MQCKIYFVALLSLRNIMTNSLHDLHGKLFFVVTSVQSETGDCGGVRHGVVATEEIRPKSVLTYLGWYQMADTLQETFPSVFVDKAVLIMTTISLKFS